MSGVDDPAEFGWSAAEPDKLRRSIRDADLVASAESVRAYLKEVTDPANAHRHLVIEEAKKRTGAGVAFLDLIAAGEAGLRRAEETFDPSAGHSFAAHARWWIRRALDI